MITVIGSAMMTLLARVPGLPRPGEVAEAQSMALVPGGKGVNQARAAALAGSEVSFVGRIAKDAYGREIAASLSAAGVMADCLSVDPGDVTGTELTVLAEAGEEIAVAMRGANAGITPGDVEAALHQIGAARVTVIQLDIPIEASLRGAQLARDAGGTVILNGSPPYRARPELWKMTDILVANEVEIGLLAGLGWSMDPAVAAGMLRDAGVGSVVVTLGAEGALVVTTEGEQNIAPFAVEVVDPRLAGDTFVGNLAHEIHAGSSLPVAARFASAAAAASMQRESGAVIPTREETRALAARATT